MLSFCTYSNTPTPDWITHVENQRVSWVAVACNVQTKTMQVWVAFTNTPMRTGTSGSVLIATRGAKFSEVQVTSLNL